MNPILRNVLAVLAGVILGSLVNGLIVSFSGSLIPPPEGVNPKDMESIRANIHLFEAKHFLMPFVAHALGTLLGAFLAAILCASRKVTISLIVGVVFLAGGIAAAALIPAPAWFIALDLTVAYLPMAWIGSRLGSR